MIILLAVAFTAKLVPVFQEQEGTEFEEKPVFGYILFVIIIISIVLAVYFFYIFFQEPSKHPKHSFRVTITYIVAFTILFLLSYYFGSRGTILEEKNGIEGGISEKPGYESTIPEDIEHIEEKTKTETKHVPKEIFFILGAVAICFFLFKVPRKSRARGCETIFEEKTSYEDQKNEAIVEYYKKTVLLLNKKGVPYKDSFTHWELEDVVEKKEKEEIIKDFTELTLLFEKCKYSPKNINDSDVDRALRMYGKISRTLMRRQIE